MVILRCTRKLIRYLEVEPVDDPSPSTGRLGDWYANLVPTYAGDLIVLVNEVSLITVAVPTALAADFEARFRERVFNLLLMLNISLPMIQEEIRNYGEVVFAKTASRSVIGSMNDIAYNYQFIAERGSEGGTLSLSDAEYNLSNMPSVARDILPADVARDLFDSQGRTHGAS